MREVGQQERVILHEAPPGCSDRASHARDGNGHFREVDDSGVQFSQKASDTVGVSSKEQPHMIHHERRGRDHNATAVHGSKRKSRATGSDRA